MSDFVENNEERFVATLTAGDSATFSIGNSFKYAAVTIEVSGATVETRIKGTAVVLRSSSANDAFGCRAPHMSFHCTGGQATITIDRKER